jgi:hypothetical protein
MALAIAWFVGALVVAGALFIATGLYASFPAALDILTGSASPFDEHAGVPGVMLAVVGYLLVPAVIGTFAAALFARQVERRIDRRAYEIAAKAFDDYVTGK